MFRIVPRISERRVSKRSQPRFGAYGPEARGTTCQATGAAAAEMPSTASWEESIAEDDAMGPAFRATLAMLEWPRLCQHVAAFASTTIGRTALQVTALERRLSCRKSSLVCVLLWCPDSGHHCRYRACPVSVGRCPLTWSEERPMPDVLSASCERTRKSGNQSY